MKNPRLAVLDRVASLCGADVLTILDPLQGWPARATITRAEGDCPVLLHVGTIGLSHRSRDDRERRMQNPGKGKPVLAADGALPLLIGVWEEGDAAVLVGMDARRHLGRTTRKSLFVPLGTLQHTAANGWAEHVSTSGESIIAFRAERLVEYVQIRAPGWSA